MNTRFCRVVILLSIAVLAITLTLLASSGDDARAMLQVSSLDSPVGVATATLLPTANPVEPPNAGFATLEPPTAVPLPALVVATATPKGFLPAPTIVNPNDLRSLPLAEPVVSGGISEEPTRVPAAPAATSTGVRAFVAFLNYLWLLCGSVLLIGGAVAIILVWRRGQRN